MAIGGLGPGRWAEQLDRERVVVVLYRRAQQAGCALVVVGRALVSGGSVESRLHQILKAVVIRKWPALPRRLRKRGKWCLERC